MAWLDDHPPRTQQFRCPRRRAPSGIIGVHTAENFPDETAPDTGAENVAEFIRTRSSFGSYHDLVDSDSIINLVRYECVAYHIATHSLNEHTYGVSAATQAAKWNDLDDDWVDATVRNMARASARYATWFRNRYGKIIPAFRISLSQALNGEMGFLAHSDADPDRRRDPGATFPWGDFLTYYRDEMEDDMTPEQATQLDVIYRTLVDKIAPNAWMRDRWPDIPSDGYTPREYNRAGYGHSRVASENTESAEAKLDALLAAHEGLDTAAILARIDQHATEATAQRAAILALIEQVGAGDLSADEFVDAVARRLSGE